MPKATRPAKKKKCQKGYPCKMGCISIKKNCRAPLRWQAETFAKWLKLQEERLTITNQKRSRAGLAPATMDDLGFISAQRTRLSTAQPKTAIASPVSWNKIKMKLWDTEHELTALRNKWAISSDSRLMDKIEEGDRGYALIRGEYKPHVILVIQRGLGVGSTSRSLTHWSPTGIVSVGEISDIKTGMIHTNPRTIHLAHILKPDTPPDVIKKMNELTKERKVLSDLEASLYESEMQSNPPLVTENKAAIAPATPKPEPISPPAELSDGMVLKIGARQVNLPKPLNSYSNLRLSHDPSLGWQVIDSDGDILRQPANGNRVDSHRFRERSQAENFAKAVMAKVDRAIAKIEKEASKPKKTRTASKPKAVRDAEKQVKLAQKTVDVAKTNAIARKVNPDMDMAVARAEGKLADANEALRKASGETTNGDRASDVFTELGKKNDKMRVIGQVLSQAVFPDLATNAKLELIKKDRTEAEKLMNLIQSMIDESTGTTKEIYNYSVGGVKRALEHHLFGVKDPTKASPPVVASPVPDNQGDLFNPPKPKDNPVTFQSQPLSARDQAIAKAIRKEEQRLYQPRKVSFAPKSTGKKKTEAEKVREIKDLIAEHEALVADGKIPVPTYSTSTPPLSGFTPTAKAYIAESLLRVAPGLKEPAPVDLLSNTAYETLKQIQKGFNSEDGSLVAAIESLSHRKPSDDILKKDEDKRIAAKELMKMGIIVKSRTRNGKQEYALNADTKDEIPSMDLGQKPLAPNEGEFLSINIPGASSFNVRNTPRAILAFLKGAGIKPEELEDLSDRLKTLSFAERRGITRFEVLKLKGLARHINYCFEPSQRGNTGRGFGLVC